MSVGRRVRWAFEPRQDAVTGAQILRLTPPDIPCHRNYFYQKCFTRDGRHLLFGARLERDWALWLLDLATGEAVQLTEGPGCNAFGSFLSPDDRYAYYVHDRTEVRRIELTTLAETTAFHVPAGWKGAGTWVPNSTCTRLAAMLVDARDMAASTGWQRFREQYQARPRTRLVSIDLVSGDYAVVHEDRRYLGHPTYRPGDDGTLGFCHEGPHDLVAARMWLVNADGSGLRRIEQAPGEFCMHEFWVPDGSRLVYVSYTAGEAQRWICAADPHTLASERLMAMPPCAHLMSNHDGSLLVGDGAGQLNDVADQGAHAFEADPHLYLFDLREGSRRRLAVHGSSCLERYGKTQMTHPHPSFTPDEKQVLFTSDCDGEPALYLATV